MKYDWMTLFLFIRSFKIRILIIFFLSKKYLLEFENFLLPFVYFISSFIYFLSILVMVRIAQKVEGLQKNIPVFSFIFLVALLTFFQNNSCPVDSELIHHEKIDFTQHHLTSCHITML